MLCSSPRLGRECQPGTPWLGWAGLQSSEQSQQVRGHRSSLACGTWDVFLVFGSPAPGQLSTQEPRALLSPHSESNSPGLFRDRNPKSSEIWQEFLALGMVYILEQAECSCTEPQPPVTYSISSLWIYR